MPRMTAAQKAKAASNAKRQATRQANKAAAAKRA